MSKKLGRKKLIHLADRVLNKPLYVTKDYAMNALNFFGGRAGYNYLITQDGKIPIKQELFDDDDVDRGGFQLLENNTAILPISGTLTHDGTGANMMSSLGQGYNGLTNMAREIASNGQVERVAMMIGSNGGEVSGCSSCAETLSKIFAEADLPVWAFVDENAYSAAYWQAVVADRIVLPSSGGVGSVGTVLTHVSYEKQIEEAGMEITMIHSGDKKVTGNPYKNLTQEEYEELDTEIEYYGNLFRQGVNQFRPDLSIKKLEDAQAGTFPGQVAVYEGFADEVMNKDDFFNAFAEVKRNSTTISIGEIQMDEKELSALKAKAAEADDLKKQLENSEKEKKVAIKKAESDADRFKDVLASDEAKGKREKALEILGDKDFSHLSADKVKTLLSSMASEEPEKEEEEKEEEPEKEEEEELHPDAEALLKTAKKNGATSKVESLGESKEKAKKEKQEKEEKSYSAEVEDDPEERLASFIASASIVKSNIARFTI